MSKFITLLACVGSIAQMSVAGADVETLRVSAYLPEHSRSVSQVIAPWLDRIETASNGEIRFKRYWGGSLGRGPQRQVLLLTNGVTELAFIWPGMTPGRFSDLQLLETPLLIRNAVESATVAWTLYSEGLLRGFEDMQVLGFYTVSPTRLFTVEALRPVTDLRPLKIRTVGPVQAKFIESLGGLPETLDAAAVSDALRRGTVDGLIQGWTGLKTFRQYRDSNYFVDLPVGVLTFAIAMNRERWRSLDARTKAYFTEAGGLDFARRAGAAFDREAGDIRAALIAEGQLAALPMTASDIRTFEERSEAAIDEWVGVDPHRKALLARTLEILDDLR